GSPGWTTNQWAGRFCQIQTVFGSVDPTNVRRRIVSNTADTLTLDYGVGCAVSDGDALTIYERLEFVSIENLSIEGPSASDSGACLVIQFAESVELRNVQAKYSTSNGITVNSCARVRMWDCVGEETQFGIFVYNSDDVKLFGCSAKNINGDHSIQLKDCRNSAVISPTVFGGALNAAATRGIDVKCSGLNPAFNVHVLDGVVEGVKGAGIEAYGLQNEGDQFHLENASISGRVCAGVNVPSVGFRLSNDDGGVIKNVRAHDIQSYGCASGIAILASDVEVSDFTFERSTGRAINGVSA